MRLTCNANQVKLTKKDRKGCFIIMQEITKDFLQIYEKEFAELPLPAFYKEEYKLYSCYKHTQNKSIFLLQRKIKKENDTELCILKIARNHFKEQLKAEATFLQTMQQKENETLPFPKLLHFDESEQETYLLRNYISGISLSEYLEKRLVLKNEEILDFMIEICDIIFLLHNNTTPVIHRDIKAENFIKSTKDGKLYLIDFDTIRLYNPKDNRDTQFLGTPIQAAPEQFGYSQSDIRTDIYALGKTMLYLCTGSYDDAMLQKCSLDPSLRHIIKKCISFDPKKRYPSVKNLQSKLLHIRKRLTIRIPKTTIASILFLLSLCLSVLNIFYFTNPGNTQKSPSPAKKSVIATSVPDKTATKESSIDETGIQSETSDNTDTKENEEAPTLSLQEQANYVEPDFTPYKKYVDQIILNCYQNDIEGVANQYHKMITLLYKDKTFKNVIGKDYAGLSKLPESAEIQPDKQTIMDCLEYRDKVILKYLPDFRKYKNYIYSELSGFISIDYSGLYLYASGAKNENGDYEANYISALIDLVRVLTLTFDHIDHIEVHPY